MTKYIKPIIIVVVIFALVLFVVDRLLVQNQQARKLTYTEFYQAVQRDQVDEVTISNQHEVIGKFRKSDANDKFTTTIPDDRDIYGEMRKHGVNVSVENSTSTPVLQILFQVMPLALMALLLVFLLRQAQSGGSQALSFVRSRAKLQNENRP